MKKNILDRLKLHYQLGTDIQLAEKLGLKPNTLSMWRSRGSIDYALIFTKCDDIDFHWLITGVVLDRSSSQNRAMECSGCEAKERIIQAQESIINGNREVIELLRQKVDFLSREN